VPLGVAAGCEDFEVWMWTGWWEHCTSMGCPRTLTTLETLLLVPPFSFVAF
jgi:hypothetical protein